MFHGIRIRIRFVLSLVSMVVLSSQLGMAQENQDEDEKQFLGRPFARLWYPATAMVDNFKFVAGVAKEVGLDTFATWFSSIERQFKEFRKSREGRRAGVLFFLVRKKAANTLEALLPAANFPEIKTVQFLVIEREEFEAFVKHEMTMYGGDVGKLEGGGDRFTIALPDYRQYFRHANGVMYHSDLAELLTTQLPNAKDVKIDAKNAEWDVYAELDPTAIDKKTRGLAWQAVRLATQTALQQFDTEDDTTYFARRSTGEFQLNILESMILDTDQVRFGMKYATDIDPVRIVIEIDAREKSDLAKHFGNLSRGDKRLASLRDQPAALTFATSWSIPDAGKKMVDGQFKLGRAKLEQLLGTNFEAMIAVDELFKVFAKSLEAGTGDMVLKLARTDNEFAVFGGMKLVDAERVGKSLELLLRALPEADGSGVRTSVDEEGRSYLSFLTEDIPFRVVKESIDRVPGRLHFCVADETLWFCLGGADSLKSLQGVIKTAAIAADKPRRDSVQFLIDLSLDRWLADGKTADGFSRLPHRALESLERLVHDWQVGAMSGAVQTSSVSLKTEDGKETTQEVVTRVRRKLTPFKQSYLDKLLTDRQSGLRVELKATPQQIRFEANVGLGLAKILVAQVMVVQMGWMSDANTPPEVEAVPATEPAKP